MVLTAGYRSVPGVKEKRQRDEGMAIILSEAAVGAENAAGRNCIAWSSRLISVKLK